jgi:hypothetical protein
MLLDELRLGKIVCTTALEVRLLAALVAERRYKSRLPKPKPKPPNPPKPQIVCAPEPLGDFVGPPEMYGPPRPAGHGWRPFSSATILDVQKAVATQWKTTVADIKSDRRTKDIVGPRHIAVMLCTVEMRCSLPKLGFAFGGRDHTTILHSKLKYDWLRRELIARLSAGEPLCTWVRTAHELWLAKATDDNPAFISRTQRARALEYWQNRKQQEAVDKTNAPSIVDDKAAESVLHSPLGG